MLIPPPRRRALLLLAAIAAVAGWSGAARADATPPTEAPPLVLSEVMVNPTGDDAGREWFELYNAGDEPVPLAGLAFEVVGVGVLTVGEITDAAVAGRSYVVLGAGAPTYLAWAAAAAPAAVVDVPVFGEALLPNASGALRVLWHGARLDELVWGAPDTPVTAGAALNREPLWDTPTADPRAGEWCAATTPIDGAATGGAGGAEGETDRGTPGAPNVWCDSDGDGFAEDEGDCDDTLLAVAPDAHETCNGRDDDCNGVTDEDAAVPVTVACLGDGVCAGAAPVCAGAAGWTCPYPDSHEADERSCDGVDNDCDGETDEGLRNRCGKCGALPEDVCDGVDNDCDDETDEDAGAELGGNGSCDGLGVCAGVSLRCAGAAGWTCDWPATWEDPEERSCDGLDNDCDGATDEPFDLGTTCVVGRGVCARTGVRICARAGDGAICDAVADPAGRERCGNGLDDDCDGETDEGFDLGAECVLGVGACRTRGKLVCSADGLGTECSASLPEPVAEICDNDRDDDCDGAVDEAPCAAPGDDPLTPEAASCAAGGATPAAPPLLPLLLLFSGLLAGRATRRRAR